MYYRACEGASWADNGRVHVTTGEAVATYDPLAGWNLVPGPNGRDDGPNAGGARAAHETNIIGNAAPGNVQSQPLAPGEARDSEVAVPVASYTQPLISERVRGVDGAGGHPHAGMALAQFSRPWEFDNPDWGANYYGLHVLEVPGAWEPAGLQQPLGIPQPLTTRVPPPRWDEAYRLAPFAPPAPGGAESSGL